jgi:hypothetical protein
VGNRPLAITLLAVLGSIAPAPTVSAQVVDSTTLRPTDVEVTIANDPYRPYNGTYKASGISRICGKLDLMMPHRANSFNVEFPDDEPNLAVPSVQFDADTLPAGATTNSFYLSVGIRTPSGGTPPHYVVRAKEEPKYGEPGTAIRTQAASRDTLKVVGTATKGTKVNVRMTLVCHPKP